MEKEINLIKRELQVKTELIRDLQVKVDILDTKFNILKLDIDIYRAMSNKKVDQMVDGRVIATFDNGSQAADKTGVEKSSIYKCLRKENKSAGGYRWRYSLKT